MVLIDYIYIITPLTHKIKGGCASLQGGTTHINTCNRLYFMKLSIYYHIWAPACDPLVRLLIDEQMKRLQLQSLNTQAKLNVVIVGAAADRMEPFIKSYEGVIVRDVITEEEGWELHTLKVLHDDCIKEPNQFVMYMHTKGLSHFYKSGKTGFKMSYVNTWRHFMELICIDGWKECVEDLKEYDAVGMNYAQIPFIHFSGNFWWARGEFIAKHHDPLTYKDINPAPNHPGVMPRHQAEAWIGTIKGKFKSRKQVTSSMYSNDKFSQYKIAKATT